MKPGTTTKELGVALSGDAYEQVLSLGRIPHQEQVRLFYWRPSKGMIRESLIIDPSFPIPTQEELVEHGNVAFTDSYLMRVLAGIPTGAGIGIVHNHFSPGWQGLSRDDAATEGRHLAPVVNAATGLPLLGMTVGSDGFLSARLWTTNEGITHRQEIQSVRVVGKILLVFKHPSNAPKMRGHKERRVATTSVWGPEKQALLESFRVGIVGLGSVGSMIAESLARMGVRDYVLIDHDRLEARNLDRTTGSTRMDARLRRQKTSIAARGIRRAATGGRPHIRLVNARVQEDPGLEALLDCDFVFSCVDRHLPRYILDYLAFAHLVPVINGGIAITLPNEKRQSLDVSWQVHLVAPGRPCMGCLEAYRYALMGLERSGMADDPAYIEGVPKLKDAFKSSENVFCFSMSCAAHEIMQFLAYALDTASICNVEPKSYLGVTGDVFKSPTGASSSGTCKADCQIKKHESRAIDLRGLLA